MLVYYVAVEKSKRVPYINTYIILKGERVSRKRPPIQVNR